MNKKDVIGMLKKDIKIPNQVMKKVEETMNRIQIETTKQLKHRDSCYPPRHRD